ncbi:MAG: hypothetical protein KJ042_12205 [Deltaproteobacteria bacterium]|nr:hypothetical protein [Deltaproteobacteria bacterium]
MSTMPCSASRTPRTTLRSISSLSRVTLVETSAAPCAAPATLRAISRVVAVCSSMADAIVTVIVPISPTTLPMRSTAPTAAPVVD